VLFLLSGVRWFDRDSFIPAFLSSEELRRSCFLKGFSKIELAVRRGHIFLVKVPFFPQIVRLASNVPSSSCPPHSNHKSRLEFHRSRSLFLSTLSKIARAGVLERSLHFFPEFE